MSTEKKKKTAHEQVWSVLSAVDVGPLCKTIPAGNKKLSYLSWANAWAVLKSYFPTSAFHFHSFANPRDGGPELEALFYPGGTAEVKCTVVVSVGSDDVSYTYTLPVMDSRNNALPNPDSRKINDSKARCLTKVIALHGLGHNLYAGEDLPTATALGLVNAEADETMSKIASFAEARSIPLGAVETFYEMKKGAELGAVDAGARSAFIAFLNSDSGLLAVQQFADAENNHQQRAAENNQ